MERMFLLVSTTEIVVSKTTKKSVQLKEEGKGQRETHKRRKPALPTEFLLFCFGHHILCK